MASNRLLTLQARVDVAQDQLQAELNKGNARDKSLVLSYEMIIAELEGELKLYTSRAGKLVQMGLMLTQ